MKHRSCKQQSLGSLFLASQGIHRIYFSLLFYKSPLPHLICCRIIHLTNSHRTVLVTNWLEHHYTVGLQCQRGIISLQYTCASKSSLLTSTLLLLIFDSSYIPHWSNWMVLGGTVVMTIIVDKTSTTTALDQRIVFNF